MNTNAGRAAEKANRRLRFEMLGILHASRTNQHGGWVTGRFVSDVIETPMLATDESDSLADERVMGLLKDLVNKGLSTHEDNREDRRQVYGLDYATFRITGEGSSFLNRTRPADADIDDGRIVK